MGTSETMKKILLIFLMFFLVGCFGAEPVEEDLLAGIQVDEQFIAIYSLFLTTTEEFISFDEWLEQVKGEDGEDGEDGRESEFRVSETHIQWRYVGETEWRDLLSLASITGPQGPVGPAGPSGQSGASGSTGATGAQGPRGDVGPQGLVGQAGKDGKDGREVVFTYESGLASWRYSDEAVSANRTLFTYDVETVSGVTLAPGREVEFQVDNDEIQWRYVGTDTWSGLVPLADIKGDTGASGITTFEVSGLAGLNAALRNVVNNVDAAVLGIRNNELKGFGSAVVYQQSGTTPYTYYAITNFHVVERSGVSGAVTNVDVFLDEFTFITGTVLGFDILSDIAVVSFTSAREITPPPVATINDLRRGELVIAMGSPLGLEYFNTSTMGIVSGNPRYIISEALSLNVRAIQHDAAINPGNSGGPLFNINNELIGINFLKNSRNTFNIASIEGMGFAISIDIAKHIADQIIASGSVVRSELGITVVDVRAVSSVSQTSGIYVSGVTASGPSNTKLNVGDVIFKVDSTLVRTPGELMDFILFKKPAENITVHYIRGDAVSSVVITLGQRSP